MSTRRDFFRAMTGGAVQGSAGAVFILDGLLLLTAP